MAETKEERLNRELGELVQELRIMLPGVQVLFAFLLTVPFSQRFGELTRLEKGLYLTSLSAAAVASVLLLAPSAFHRLRFREHDKERLLLVSNRFAVIGTVFLAVSMASAIYLITEFIYGTRPASAIAGGLSVLLVAVWYVVPLAGRGRR